MVPYVNMRLKVAQFIQDLSGGGAERAVVNIANSFSAAGYDSAVFCVEATGSNVRLLDESVQLIDLKAKRLRYSVSKLRRILQEERPDVVFAHMHQTFLMLSIAAFGLRTPPILVGVAHSYKPIQKLESRSPFLIVKAFLEKILIRRLKKIVAVSSGIRDGYEGIYGIDKSRLTVIYNPTPLSEIRNHAKQAPKHPWVRDSSPTVVALGRLHEAKGFDVLVNSFAHVHNSTGARLVIFGEGPLENSLNQLIENLGLLEVVSLAGYYNNPYPELASANVLVLSSNWEGLPTVLIEALALGTPVVATDCKTGPREILCGGEFGRLVPVGDAHELSLAIISTLREGRSNPEILEKRAETFGSQLSEAAYRELIAELLDSA